ncbi:MAG: AmmeMemoRadiSam system protein A [Bellilinea sp.]
MGELSVGGLTPEEKRELLKLAREALEMGVRGQSIAPLDVNSLLPILREQGASFVTLTKNGQLRGCIGTLEARLPLAEDVREHAIAAGLDDYRFPPVSPRELDEIEIEISRLTTPQPLEYTSPEELLRALRPGIDGVVLRDRFRRATFLPQVWEQLPEPESFLDHLCQKMGAPRDYWRCNPLRVEIYQVEEFHEEKE